MADLRLQKRLAASIMKCGKRKVWMDPNEFAEHGMANTRVMVRKLIRDGFIIKKPKKIHSRFRARRRRVEKKKGRHLGYGKRKGTRNARCSTKMLWMKRQRAMRRLLRRYFIAGRIDRSMYHRYYMKAKGNAFKNKAALIERIANNLAEKERSQKLLEQYKVRREEALVRKREKEEAKRKLLEEQLKLAEEAEQIRLQQEAQKSEKKKKGKKSKATKGGRDDEDRADRADRGKKEERRDDGDGGKKKRRRKRKETADPSPKPEAEEKPKKRRKRGKKKKSEE